MSTSPLKPYIMLIYTLINGPAKRRLFLLSLLFLSACSSLQKNNFLPAIPLMPPKTLEQHWQLSQSVTLQTDNTLLTNAISDQLHSLMVAWSINNRGLDFVGLTPSGHILMTLRYDGEDFSEEYSPALTLTRPGMILPGRDIIAQLQLTYWPITAINQQFKATPWRIVATNYGRSLYLGKRKILDIHITPADQKTGQEEIIIITNIPLDYRLTIRTLTRTILP